MVFSAAGQCFWLRQRVSMLQFWREREEERVSCSKCLSVIAAMCLSFTGCGKQSSQDAKKPVTIEVWTYYNGDQLMAFENLVEEFNETVGKEEGIAVKSSSQGSVNDLETNVLAALKGK